MSADARAANRPHAPGAALDRSAFLRPIAHRGLHDASKGRIENTGPAFQAAIDRRYGIECDLQAAGDGTPMVFHDEKLGRLADAAGPIAAYTPAQLARFRFKGQDISILGFAQFLEMVAGRVPLLVEIKRNRKRPEYRYLESIAMLASGYRGPIALMSFDRDIVAALGTLAPSVPRGLVVGSHQLAARLLAGGRAARGPAVPGLLGSAPDGVAFFAIDVRILRVASRWLSRHWPELVLFSWTVRTKRERAVAARWADAPIFEGYEP
jgi:glycerophosphoryl diester phosphodiesterase